MVGTPFTQTDWATYAECYDALTQLQPYQDMLKQVLMALTLAPQSTILDVGCGTGNLLHALWNQEPRALLHGLDGSAPMLARARNKLPQADLQQTDFTLPLPCDSGIFSHVCSTNVLYAVPNPGLLVSEIHRVLAPGGVAVITTPKSTVDNGMILKAHCQSQKSDNYWQNPHTSLERERALVYEAIAENRLRMSMLAVAAFNRRIAVTPDFTFYTANKLKALFADCDFDFVELQSTYADQCFQLTVRKGA